jgi:hypothetical protein
MRVAVFGQNSVGINGEMPESLLFRMCQRAINPIPDFDNFIRLEIDKRHDVNDCWSDNWFLG